MTYCSWCRRSVYRVRPTKLFIDVPCCQMWSRRILIDNTLRDTHSGSRLLSNKTVQSHVITEQYFRSHEEGCQPSSNSSATTRSVRAQVEKQQWVEARLTLTTSPRVLTPICTSQENRRRSWFWPLYRVSNRVYRRKKFIKWQKNWEKQRPTFTNGP